MAWMRKPRTMQERRAAESSKHDGVPVRGRRRGRNLPSDWDDKPVAAQRVLCWKNFRLTRWREQ